MRTIKLSVILFFIFLQIEFVSKAQNSSVEPAGNSEPSWIQMMDDENVNYFAAVDAFNLYFKSHPMPGEEVEEKLMGGDESAKQEHEKEMRRENKKIRTEKQRRELVEQEKLNYEVKRFRNWMEEVKPFVQENGHILTTQERTAIWNKQQEEMKNNKLNKK